MSGNTDLLVDCTMNSLHTALSAGGSSLSDSIAPAESDLMSELDIGEQDAEKDAEERAHDNSMMRSQNNEGMKVITDIIVD